MWVGLDASSCVCAQTVSMGGAGRLANSGRGLAPVTDKSEASDRTACRSGTGPPA